MSTSPSPLPEKTRGAYGTARHVAQTSTLPDHPREKTRDLEHVFEKNAWFLRASLAT